MISGKPTTYTSPVQPLLKAECESTGPQVQSMRSGSSLEGGHTDTVSAYGSGPVQAVSVSVKSLAGSIR